MISVVIPIYNAENIIADNYKILKKGLENTGEDYEILFEDDASYDNSKDILNNIARVESKVRVFSHYPNRGLGFSLRQLFKQAKGDILAYLDIDLPFGVDKLPFLLKELKDADIVLASRYFARQNKIPFSRRIASSLYYFLCKVLFNIPVRDIGSGCVFFKRSVFKNIELFSNGFDIHIELFAKLHKRGFLIKEIPLLYFHNGYSTFSISKHGPRVLIDTIKFRLKNK